MIENVCKKHGWSCMSLVDKPHECPHCAVGASFKPMGFFDWLVSLILVGGLIASVVYLVTVK